MTTDTEAQSLLTEHRRVWGRKPALRRIYREEFFSRLISLCLPGGISVEVGAGPGFLKEMAPDFISTDIIRSPWLDAIADAQHLPFRSSSITNLVGLDVLHHFETPMAFLMEAERVLAPGGRLVLIEPWVTPFSYLIYRFLHQEDCDLNTYPLEGKAIQSKNVKKAFDGNQAIPYLLFGPRSLAKTVASLPGFKPVKVEPFCLLAYLLSFGFKRMNLLPVAFYPLISQLERRTLPLWRSAAALRVLLVFERQRC